MLFQMTGTAGRFSISALTTTFGAGVALLSIRFSLFRFFSSIFFPFTFFFKKQIDMRLSSAIHVPWAGLSL